MFYSLWSEEKKKSRNNKEDADILGLYYFKAMCKVGLSSN